MWIKIWRKVGNSFTCKTNTLTILMHQMRISTTQVSSVMLRSKKLEIWGKCENWKSCRMKTKQSAMKLSQIRGWIKLHCMPERDNPSFWDELQNLLFSWQFNLYSYFKASIKVHVLGNISVQSATVVRFIKTKLCCKTMFIRVQDEVARQP
jgi:hypothetical protein